MSAGDNNYCLVHIGTKDHLEFITKAKIRGANKKNSYVIRRA